MQVASEPTDGASSLSTEARTRALASHLAGFAEATRLALVVVNQSGQIEFSNGAASLLLGYSQEELYHQSVDIIIPEAFRGSHHAGFARVVAGGETRLAGRTVEVAARRRDGSEVPIDLSLSVWRYDGMTFFGAVMSDITERRERNERLLHRAHSDNLTGLHNRRHFETLLDEAMADGRFVMVAIADLDGFSDINDSLGHAVGDSLLRAIAIRLPAALGADTTIGRLGGDEFAIFLPLIALEETQRHIDEISEAFVEPFEVGGSVFQIGVSVGVAIGPDHGTDAEELIAGADFAVRQAKEDGGRCWRSFDVGMRRAAIVHRARQDEILLAHRHGEFCLHYQPQISLDDRCMVGAEALIRWHHPVRGLLTPVELLSVIQGSALELSVGWWTLDEACRQIAQWKSEGRPPLRIGVNLFPAQFLSGTLVQRVDKALSRYGINPEQLELEHRSKSPAASHSLASPSAWHLRLSMGCTERKSTERLMSPFIMPKPRAADATRSSARRWTKRCRPRRQSRRTSGPPWSASLSFFCITSRSSRAIAGSCRASRPLPVGITRRREPYRRRLLFPLPKASD